MTRPDGEHAPPAGSRPAPDAHAGADRASEGGGTRGNRGAVREGGCGVSNRAWIDAPVDEGATGDMLTMDGFDDAIVGIASRCGQPDLVVYDREKCIEILMRDMPEDDAREYFEFNCEGAWMGELTPVILRRPDGVK